MRMVRREWFARGEEIPFLKCKVNKMKILKIKNRQRESLGILMRITSGMLVYLFLENKFRYDEQEWD